MSLTLRLGLREWGAGEWMAGLLGAVGLARRDHRLRAVEAWFAAAYGRPVFLLDSGTTALVLALRALRERRPQPDTVLLPAFGCPALTAAVHGAGLKPRYVDIGEDLNVRPQALRGPVDVDTLAFVMVHAYGLAADSDGTQAACSQLGMALIDDAAQSIDPVGGLGTRGQFGVFSFAQSKSVACGIGTAGGVLMVNDESFLDALTAGTSALRPAGGRSLAWLEFALPPRAERLGYVMARWRASAGRPPPQPLATLGTPEAGIARFQLRSLARRRDGRRRQVNWYRERLQAAGFVAPQLQAVGDPYLTRLLVYVPPHLRDACRAALARDGIATRLPYRLPQAVTPSSHPVACRAASSLLELPLPARLREPDVTHIVDALARACGSQRQ